MTKEKVSKVLAEARRALGTSSRPVRASVLGILLLVPAGLGVVLPGAEVKADEYVTAPAARGSIELLVEAKGIVQPRDTVRVTAPVPGTVTWTGPAVGSRVKRGQPLARIAPAPVETAPTVSEPEAVPVARDTNAEQAGLEAARARLEVAKRERDEAVKQAEKLEAIPDLVPRLQIEAARGKADVAEAAYEAAAARVRSAEAALSGAKAPAASKSERPAAAPASAIALPEMTVSSPIDGIVVTKQVAKGDTVKQATLFTVGTADSSVEVALTVPAADAEVVREGLEVAASVPGGEGQSFAGRLARVRRLGNAATAVVEIDGSSRELRPGTKVDVEVEIERKEGVLTVPAAALSFEPETSTGEAGDNVLWVQAAGGEIVPRTIETGATDGLEVEIVAGLVEGDLVITGKVGEEPAAAPPKDDAAPAEAAELDGLMFSRTAEVESFLNFYVNGGGRATLERAVDRSSGRRGRAEQIFAEEGVPTELVWLALVESGWRDTAVSPVGAAGVWQIMPATGQRFGLRVDGEVDERYDFEKATRAAAVYLRILAERYDGNWELAIGAYNCGEGAMDEAIARVGGVRDFWTLARSGALPDETARYVPAVLAATLIGADLG
jgi:multidrug efflux pump subunit AcrA (membrane-fusion protein)